MNRTREGVPRISVDSVQDWRRVKRNYEHALLESLESRIADAGLEAEREALRAHARQLVKQTFEIASPSLRINGRDFEGPIDDEEFEPFDEALDRRIWSLQEQRLKWDKEIATRRRTTPIGIEKDMKELLDKQRQADEEAIERVPRENQDAKYDDVDAEQFEEMEATFQRVAALSQELRQSIPTQLERAERVKAVEEEIKSLKP